MNDVIHHVLTRYKQEVEEVTAIFDGIEEDPLRFFREGVVKRPALVIERLEEKGEDALLEYQSWLYPLVIEALKGAFVLDDYSVTFNARHFPSPLFFSSGHHVVATIQPYDRLFVYEIPERLLRLSDERKQLLLDLVTYEENLALKELIEANPILAGKGNPWKTTQALLSKKKVLKTLKEEALAELELLSKAKQRLSQIEYDIEKLNQEALGSTIQLDRLAKRFQEKLGLSVYNAVEERDEEDQQFSQMELAQWRQHYHKQLMQEWGLDESGKAH